MIGQAQLDMKLSQFYKECVEELGDYLSEVLRRNLPKKNFYTAVREPIEKLFEIEWKEGSLLGWEGFLADLGSTRFVNFRVVLSLWNRC